MKVGYIRISTQEQNPLRQRNLMETLGVDKVYIDIASGKDAKRPQLQELLSFVRQGDTVMVESISRFARNTRDLLSLIDQLVQKQVSFVSKKEAIDTTTPTGRFMLTVFGAVAELEREYLLDRQREGIEQAKKAGKYRGRKPIPVDPHTFKQVYQSWKDGNIRAVDAQKRLGLSPNTFYRRVKAYEQEQKKIRKVQGGSR